MICLVLYIVFLFADNLTKVKRSMETLVAKKRNESQKMQIPRKSSPFPPAPAIIWIQQGIFTITVKISAC